MTYWNTYLSNELQKSKIFTPYTDWNRESLLLIFNNLKSGEELIPDSEVPVKFRVIYN